MSQAADFESRVASSIGASIAVKQSLLCDQILISSLVQVAQLCL